MNEVLKKREWETGQKVSAVRRSNPFHSSSFSSSCLASSRFHTPTPPFFALAFVLVLPVCLSVWPAECGCHGERAKVSALRGGSAMKPLSKPRLGIVFMFSPLSPKTGPLVLWTPILPMERGWAAAARRFGSCMLLRCAPSCELGCRSAPSTAKGAASQSEALCWFFRSVLMLVHPIHLHPLCACLRDVTVVFWLCLGLCTCAKLSAVILNAYGCSERFRTFTVYIYIFFYLHMDYKHSHKAFVLFLVQKMSEKYNLKCVYL